MDIMQSFSYPYKSRGFFGKVATFTILMLIPLVNIFGMFVLMGYAVKVIYAVSQGDPDLPEIDFGSDAGRGFTVFLAAIVYFLVPTIISTVIQFALEGSALMLVALLLIWIVNLLISAIFVVGMVRFGFTGDSSVLFQFSENFEIATQNPGYLLKFYVFNFVMSFIIGIGTFIGFMLLIIPGFIVMIAGMLSQFHLYSHFGMELGLAGKMKRKVQEY
ncbi:MAG: DUF4013 domain-containing protein [Aggregatilineales bacterium]